MHHLQVVGLVFHHRFEFLVAGQRRLALGEGALVVDLDRLAGCLQLLNTMHGLLVLAEDGLGFLILGDGAGRRHERTGTLMCRDFLA